MHSWWEYDVRFGDPKFDIVLNIYTFTSISQLVFFSPTLQISRGHLVLLLSGKAVVLPIRITFKRIDSAMLKLTFPCLINILVWNTFASVERINPVFIDIAFSDFTYDHWRRNRPQYLQRGEGAGSRGLASKDPMLQGETFFFKYYFCSMISPRNNKKN